MLTPFGPIVYWCFDHPRTCWFCLGVRKIYYKITGQSTVFVKRKRLRTRLPSLSRRLPYDGLSAGELEALATEGRTQPQRENGMNVILWLFSGGWAKDYRTQLLGMFTALTAVMDGFYKWAVGDGTLGDLVSTVGMNWEAIVAGLAIWFAGDKLNKMMDKPAMVKKI